MNDLKHVAQKYNGVFLSHETGWNKAIFSNMDGTNHAQPLTVVWERERDSSLEGHLQVEFTIS